MLQSASVRNDSSSTGPHGLARSTPPARAPAASVLIRACHLLDEMESSGNGGIYRLVRHAH